MLRADYQSRLRISSFYPIEWIKYHFFNGGTQAIAQSLLSQSNLYSYFMVQSIIFILILLSFVERIILSFRLNVSTLVALALWFVVGFSLFYQSISWNFFSSGPFSVFAAVHLVITLYLKRYRESVLFTFVLGASVFRLFPVAIVGILGHAIFLERGKSNVLNILKERNWFEYVAFAIFLGYIALTGLSGISFVPFFSGPIFHKGWLFSLSSYSILGYTATSFGVHHNLHRYLQPLFDKFAPDSTAGILFSLYFAIAIVFVLTFIMREITIHNGSRNVFTPPDRMIFWSLLVLFVVTAFHEPLRYLHFVIYPYFIFLLFFLLVQTKLGRERASTVPLKKFVYFLFLLQLTTLLFQYTGINGIKGPDTYVTFDMITWALLLVSINSVITAGKGVWAAIVVLPVALFFSVHMTSVQNMTPRDKHSYKKDVTPLFSADFDRNQFVNPETQVARFNFLDVDLEEVYGALLGARFLPSKKHQTFIAWRMLRVEIQKELLRGDSSNH